MGCLELPGGGRPLADGANIIPQSTLGEAFFPEGNTYLGRTVRQEPVRQIDVLSPTGDHL